MGCRLSQLWCCTFGRDSRTKMKGAAFLVFLLLALHTSQATLEIIEKIKRDAASNFHILSGELAKNIIDLSHKAKEQLQTIKNQAKTKLVEITNNTPLSNLLQYKSLVPSIAIGKVKDFYVSKLTKKVEKTKQHLNTKKGYLQDLIVHKKNNVQGTLAAKSREKTPALDGLRFKKNYLRAVFEGRFPYPVGTKKIVYIYE